MRNGTLNGMRNGMRIERGALSGLWQQKRNRMRNRMCNATRNGMHIERRAFHLRGALHPQAQEKETLA